MQQLHNGNFTFIFKYKTTTKMRKSPNYMSNTFGDKLTHKIIEAKTQPFRPRGHPCYRSHHREAQTIS